MSQTFGISYDRCWGFVSRVRLLVAVAAAILMAGPASKLSAQWVDGAAGAIYYSPATGGNVGIGTTGPSAKLDVSAGALPANATTAFSKFRFDYLDGATTVPAMQFRNVGDTGTNAQISFPLSNGNSVVNMAFSTYHGGTTTEDMRIQNGNVGIGTTTPLFNLHTRGVIAADEGNNVFVTLGTGVGASNSPTTYAGMWYDTTANALNLGALSGGVAWRNIVLNAQGGNVGIGTTNPTNTLSVNGIVQAKEVLVNTGWSDYVFDSGYRNRPLAEVAAYIRENHHLPGIPSAKEVEEKGVSLGDMQAKLLAKIEELTLHLIQADQQNRDLQDRIERLEARGPAAVK